MAQWVADIECALLVSDLHCGPRGCAARSVARLAIEEGASLVVLGDLFDDLHVEVSEDFLARALRAVFKGISGLDVHYVTSRSSHDPLVARAVSLDLDGLRVRVYPKALIARVGKLHAFLTHGDMALRNGAHAFLVNVVATILGERLYLEKLLKRRQRLPSSWWLIMGHTHLPGIDYEARVANTGSWRAHWWAGAPYWRPPSNTYILMRDGKVELHAVRVQQALRGAGKERLPWLRKRGPRT